MANHYADTDTLDAPEDAHAAPPSRRVRRHQPPAVVADADERMGLGSVVGMLDGAMGRVPWWLLVGAGVGVGWWASQKWSGKAKRAPAEAE